MKLPEGFVLDEPIKPPPGFVLEAEVTPPPGFVLESSTETVTPPPGFVLESNPLDVAAEGIRNIFSPRPMQPVQESVSQFGSDVVGALTPTAQAIPQRTLEEPQLRAPTPLESSRFNNPEIDTSRPSIGDFAGAVPLAGPTLKLAEEVIKSGGKDGKQNEELMMDLIGFMVIGKALSPVTKAGGLLLRKVGTKIARHFKSEGIAKAFGSTLEKGMQVVSPDDLIASYKSGALTKAEFEFFAKNMPRESFRKVQVPEPMGGKAEARTTAEWEMIDKAQDIRRVIIRSKPLETIRKETVGAPEQPIKPVEVPTQPKVPESAETRQIIAKEQQPDGSLIPIYKAIGATKPIIPATIPPKTDISPKTEDFAKLREGQHPSLSEYRKKTLPEYNLETDIEKIDGFVDKIEPVDPKNDDIWYKHGSRFKATVSYPHSLGENGNQTDFYYDNKPTIEDIHKDLLDTYKEEKITVNKPIAAGIVAKSGRDENIEKAIDKVLTPKAVEKEPWEMTKSEWLIQQGKIHDNIYKNYGKKLSPLVKFDRNVNARYGQEQAHEKAVRHAFQDGKPVPESVLKDYPKLKPKAVSPLESEALEYKSAEIGQYAENTADLLYHGTGEKSAQDILRSGFKTGAELQKGEKTGLISLGTKERATHYSRGEKVGTQLPIPIKGLNLLEVQAGELYPNNLAKYTKLMNEKGYDGIRVIDDIYTGSGKTAEVLLKKEVATSQLTDIWNKAHKPTTVNPSFESVTAKETAILKEINLDKTVLQDFILKQDGSAKLRTAITEGMNKGLTDKQIVENVRGILPQKATVKAPERVKSAKQFVKTVADMARSNRQESLSKYKSSKEIQDKFIDDVKGGGGLKVKFFSGTEEWGKVPAWVKRKIAGGQYGEDLDVAAERMGMTDDQLMTKLSQLRVIEKPSSHLSKYMKTAKEDYARGRGEQLFRTRGEVLKDITKEQTNKTLSTKDMEDLTRELFGTRSYSVLSLGDMEIYLDELKNIPGRSIKPKTNETEGMVFEQAPSATEEAAKSTFSKFSKETALEEVKKATQNIPPEKVPNEIVDDAEILKDISGFKGQFRDVYRNFEEVFGKSGQFAKAKKEILDPFDESKGAFVDEQKRLLDGLSKNVVDKYGFKKKSKESAAIMDFGEGKRTHLELIKEFGQTKADQIVASDKYFRKSYDDLLDKVNANRKKIYGDMWAKKKNLDTEIETLGESIKNTRAEMAGKTRTDTLSFKKLERREQRFQDAIKKRIELMNSDDWWRGKVLPKRKDYYRHFKEMAEGIEGLINAFDTPSGISPKLSGISPITKPKTKFAGFMQKRLTDESDRDAIGGFLEYVPVASYSIHIDPHIMKFRGLASELAKKTEETKNVNNFIEFLQDYSNDLAGKSNPADRYFQKIIPGGRTTMNVINWTNKRIKANTILGNAASSLAQIFNVPQAIGSAKQHSIGGATRTLASIFAENKPMQESNFIKERYVRDIFNKFNVGILNKPKQFAAWMVGALDEVGTKFAWNAHYEKAINEGIKEPIKYADDIARKMVAGRGVGEVPIGQKSKLFQLVAPFQLEVANAWWAMNDFVNAKDFAGLALMLTTGWMMNRVAEKVRGSDVVFDPINAIYDGVKSFQKEENKLVGAAMFAGRLGGEILSNIPLGQTLAAMYPEYGFKGITRKELFGEGDPTRFGGGILVGKGLQDPLFKILPPFGGGQIKKTFEGLKAVSAGKVESKSGVKRYDVKKELFPIAQTLIFGKYSTKEARDHFDGKKEEPSKREFKPNKKIFNTKKFGASKKVFSPRKQYF